MPDHYQPISQFEPHVQAGAQTLICPRPDQGAASSYSTKEGRMGQVRLMLCTPPPAPFCLPLQVLPGEVPPTATASNWLVTACSLGSVLSCAWHGTLIPYVNETTLPHLPMSTLPLLPDCTVYERQRCSHRGRRSRSRKGMIMIYKF